MRITTVTGDISPEKAGLTSIHEHVLANMELMEGVPIPEHLLSLAPDNMAFLRNGASVFSRECMILNDVDYAVAELTAFRQRAGGGMICDASPIGMRGDIRMLQEASLRSGVSLVCSTGLYLLNRHPKEFRDKNYEDQIVLGHDIINKASGITTGYYGFTRFAEFVPSMLKPLGFANKVIQKLMVDNPARILAY